LPNQAARKTAVETYALAPHKAHQKRLVEAYKAEKARSDLELDKWKQDRATAIKDGDIDSVPAEPAQPLQPHLIVGDATYEGLFRLLRYGQPSAGLFNSEGGAWLGGYSMQAEHQLRTLASFSGLWDDGCCDRSRGEDGTTSLYGRRVSLHLMIQPKPAGDLFGNELARDQGFLSRVLAAWPESRTGKRPYNSKDLWQNLHYLEYKRLADQHLARDLPIVDGDLQPEQLRLDSDSQLIWVAFHDLCDREAAVGGCWEAVSGFANKAPEHALRLAGVTSYFHGETLTPTWIKRGIELARWYLEEAVRIRDAGAVPAEIRKAENVLQWLQDQDLQQFCAVQIYQRGPYATRNKRDAKEAVDILVDHGHAVPLPSGTIIDGKARKEAWALV